MSLGYKTSCAQITCTKAEKEKKTPTSNKSRTKKNERATIEMGEYATQNQAFEYLHTQAFYWGAFHTICIVELTTRSHNRVSSSLLTLVLLMALNRGHTFSKIVTKSCILVAIFDLLCLFGLIACFVYAYWISFRHSQTIRNGTRRRRRLRLSMMGARETEKNNNQFQVMAEEASKRRMNKIHAEFCCDSKSIRFCCLKFNWSHGTFHCGLCIYETIHLDNVCFRSDSSSFATFPILILATTISLCGVFFFLPRDSFKCRCCWLLSPTLTLLRFIASH